MKSNSYQNYYLLSLALTALWGISVINTASVLAAPDLSLPSSRATRALTLRQHLHNLRFGHSPDMNICSHLR